MRRVPDNGACHICKRVLDVADDPLSVDCGGDCWGCVGFFEYEMERHHSASEQLATPQIVQEIRSGLRNADGSGKPPASGLGLSQPNS